MPCTATGMPQPSSGRSERSDTGAWADLFYQRWSTVAWSPAGRFRPSRLSPQGARSLRLAQAPAELSRASPCCRGMDPSRRATGRLHRGGTWGGESARRGGQEFTPQDGCASEWNPLYRVLWDPGGEILPDSLRGWNIGALCHQSAALVPSSRKADTWHALSNGGAWTLTRFAQQAGSCPSVAVYRATAGSW